jgi:hypothetical protein
MGRYNDINRGPELNKAYIERQEWLQKTADQKQAAFKSVAKPRTDRVKPERIPAYVRPFNQTRDGIFYECRGLSPTQTGAGSNVAGTARTIVGARIEYDAPSGATDTVIDIKRYRFAKITLSQRTGNGDENAKSRITGRPYTRYRSDNVSSPFGKLGADVNYQDAVQELMDTAPYKAFVAAVGNQAGFTPEG